MAERLNHFDSYRPLLFSIAYRMLGSVMDAEDIVQEAFLRWQKAPEAEVQSPKAYLSAVVTRLCIDHLRSARVKREDYVGPWLPEPLVTDDMPDALETAARSESLSLAFLVLLESLSPTERAVFLLREVFDYDYAEIARIVGKTEAACRKMAQWAHEHIAARRPRFDAPQDQQRQAAQFAQALGAGDVPGLLSLLADDAVLWADGGGRVRAALNPIHGRANVARFLVGAARKAPPGFVPRFAQINGQPGLVGYVDGQPFMVLALDIAEG